MHSRHLKKPDGRGLALYGRSPIPEDIQPTALRGLPSLPSSHLRWHPLRGEWVIYAPYLRDRSSVLPEGADVFVPSSDPESPSELPPGTYDVAVLDDPLPVLTEGARGAPAVIVDSRPGLGASEVIVYSRDPDATLGTLPLWHLELVLEVWGERYRELGARSEVQYVFPYDSGGASGPRHAHGRIHGYPFVPPIAARQLREQRLYFEDHDRGLLEDHLQAEIEDGHRMLYTGPRAVALVPACARYPYEVWVLPRRSAPSFAELSPEERADFARALKTVLLKLERLGPPAPPHVLTVHQAPTDDRPHPEVHAHVQIYPSFSLTDRLPFLAGAEIGAGVFTTDLLPEEQAATLRAFEVDLG